MGTTRLVRAALAWSAHGIKPARGVRVLDLLQVEDLRRGGRHVGGNRDAADGRISRDRVHRDLDRTAVAVILTGVRVRDAVGVFDGHGDDREGRNAAASAAVEVEAELLAGGNPHRLRRVPVLDIEKWLLPSTH